MIRAAAVCLAALVLCSACILTKEDLDCWYDDMCMSAAGKAPVALAHPPAGEADLHLAGR